MKSFLAEVLKHKREELQRKQTARPLPSFQPEIKSGTGSFLKALDGAGLKIIAEIKPRSPSLGQLGGSLEPAARLQFYQQYAQAVSVLCDERFFGGSVDLLESVASTLSIPTLLKDFVINPYQVYEARRAGAEAVLLIVKILPKPELIELNALVLELGMTPLVEVQTEEELQIAGCLKPELILINNRNLDTLQMDLSTVERLTQKLTYSTRVVAASGVENAEQFLSIRPFASRFLIGSALMASGDPAAKFEEFRAAEANFLAAKEEVSSC